MKNLGYGKDYKYAHSYENNFTDLDFLPDAIKGTKLYNPGNNPKEFETKEKLKSFGAIGISIRYKA